jgi:hypothetical protein
MLRARALGAVGWFPGMTAGACCGAVVPARLNAECVLMVLHCAMQPQSVLVDGPRTKLSSAGHIDLMGQSQHRQLHPTSDFN